METVVLFSPDCTALLSMLFSVYNTAVDTIFLCYLEDLLEKCEKHVLIDPTLIHFSYAYCASHVHGNRLVGLDITLKI